MSRIVIKFSLEKGKGNKGIDQEGMEKLLEPESDLQQQNRSKKEKKKFTRNNCTSYNLWSTNLGTDQKPRRKIRDSIKEYEKKNCWNKMGTKNK